MEGAVLAGKLAAEVVADRGTVERERESLKMLKIYC
jgi:hypothetical protein